MAKIRVVWPQQATETMEFHEQLTVSAAVGAYNGAERAGRSPPAWAKAVVEKLGWYSADALTAEERESLEAYGKPYVIVEEVKP